MEQIFRKLGENSMYGKWYAYSRIATGIIPRLVYYPTLFQTFYHKPSKLKPYLTYNSFIWLQVFSAVAWRRAIDPYGLNEIEYRNCFVRKHPVEQYMIDKFCKKVTIEHVKRGGHFNMLKNEIRYPFGRSGILAHEIGHLQQYDNFYYRMFISPITTFSRGSLWCSVYLPLVAADTNTARDYACLANLLQLPTMLEELGKFSVLLRLYNIS
tara:strand:+ start:1428 stop:2060 length:633 start_codon:yes stop_codon:yes gene_type:complete